MSLAWPNEYIVALEALAREPLTADAIARALNQRFGATYSRNAVIGKLKRLGIRKEPVARPAAPGPLKENAARALALRAKGYSPQRIAELLRRDPPPSLPKTAPPPKRETPRGSHGSIWKDCPEADTRLRALWAQGLTASDCARVLSKELGLTVSRCALLGRLHRLGLLARDMSPGRLKGGRKLRASLSALTIAGDGTEFAGVTSAAAQARDAEILAETASPYHSEAASIPIPGPGLCKWIAGDVLKRPFAYCAAATHAGTSYCAFHHGLMWRRASPMAQRRAAAAM